MPKITLYSTHCPLCMGLEKALKEKGIKYTLCTSKQIMNEKGITRVPVLQVGDTLMPAPIAMRWVLSQE